ncbi:MAG: asparagine synthase (glutamine-hydrolyzing) [Hyphomonadaceae bacterium]|nr:asparagine synthase (glutamine-hydrolyzing) [Hyphomonadaceae bacterium]MBY0565120.1 asparagine synthase (glutamine-hydrolyzing) [Hyphomonadaceae bacterium]
MCGINGIFSYHVAASAPSSRELLATRDHMAARGPDGAGEWWSADRRTGLGHRRLAIVDLTAAGAQPMTSACERYVVIFNGEIYNYPELRRELEARGTHFTSASDTEVLLHLYAECGADMPAKLRGMFALAIWDNHARSLFLARDPYGIKPLYTANDGWTFRFASQVKALIAGRAISRDPEPAGATGFLLWGSVPEPFTLYRDIRALPAGHSQIIDEAGPRPPRAYASIAEVFADGAARPAPRDDVFSRVRGAVSESVKAHLVADVEVGVFLSAGVDSGALLGLMRDAGQRHVKAITLAFGEFENTVEDEAPLARLTARHYGAEHVVRTVGRAEFEAELPAILQAMDQPSIDGVNTWFVAKAAHEAGLKVALSGLGGDELLAGYPSFRDVPRWVSLLAAPSRVPGLGRAARMMLTALGVGRQNPKAVSLLEYGGAYPGAYLLRRALYLPHELDALLDAQTVRDGLRRLKSLAALRASMTPAPARAQSRVALLESANYMRNQLLRDADWAGMAHSLEIRTPLVDFDLLKALSPVTPRLSPGTGKQALAAAPNLQLPRAIVDRRRTGFCVPTGHWAAAANATTAASKGAGSRAWAREVLKHFGVANASVAGLQKACTGVAAELAR